MGALLRVNAERPILNAWLRGGLTQRRGDAEFFLGGLVSELG